ncbi:MAG: hypothetical protein ACK44A_12375 [Roseateles sp.]
MSVIRMLLRLLVVAAGAVLGLVLFLFAVLAFAVLLLVSVLRGRKPNLQFRMNKNPWAARRPPAAKDVVDVEAREVRDSAPLPWQPPRR